MGKSGKKVTMRDIASRLGVSPATVHRALTEKGNVSENTLRVIQKTAMDMGYHTRNFAPSLAISSTKIAVILRNVMPEYNNLIKDGVNRAIRELAEYNVQGSIVELNIENYLDELNEQLSIISEMGYDGVIFYVAQTGSMVDPVIIEKLVSKNIKMGTIFLSDGIDNCLDIAVAPDGYRAGTVAANILALNGLGEGSKAIMFLGKKNFPLHSTYLQGFSDGCSEWGIELFDVIEHRDNPNIAYYAAEQFLRENPNIEGIYCCSATTAPVCRAVQELGLKGKVKMIGTDVMSSTVSYVKDGTLVATLFQDPFKMGYKVFRELYNVISGKEVKENRISINPQIVVKANVDYYARFTDTKNRSVIES